MADLLFRMDPEWGVIVDPITGDHLFGEGNNFVYQRRRDRRLLASPEIRSLRGKIDGDHPSIRLRDFADPDKTDFVRFRIRGDRRGNERSELAHGRRLDAEETHHFAMRFRVSGEIDKITEGGFAYVLQGWEPVERPRFGIRLLDEDTWDVTSRSGGGRRFALAEDGRWNLIAGSFNDEDGIAWRSKSGRVIARSPGGFMADPEDGIRLKFGFYGRGGGNLNVDVADFAVGADLDEVLEALS